MAGKWEWLEKLTEGPAAFKFTICIYQVQRLQSLQSALEPLKYAHDAVTVVKELLC